MKRVLVDVAAGKIDVILIYKRRVMFADILFPSAANSRRVSHTGLRNQIWKAV